MGEGAEFASNVDRLCLLYYADHARRQLGQPHTLLRDVKNIHLLLVSLDTTYREIIPRKTAVRIVETLLRRNMRNMGSSDPTVKVGNALSREMPSRVVGLVAP